MFRIIFIFIFAIFGLILGGFAAFYESVDFHNQPQKADAIVVLTGGSGRVATGVELLENEAAPKLFITGVGKDAGVKDILNEMDLPEDLLTKIELGHEAENTIGNAVEARSWLVDNQISSIILVTSNYHMPRSMLTFKRGLGSELQIHPHVVQVEGTKFRKMLLSEYAKFIGASLLF